MNPKLKITNSMLIYGSIGIFVKSINLPTSLIVLVRAAIGFAALFILTLFAKTKTDKAVLKKALPILLVLGAMIGLNWALLFEAYNYTYVSVATLCYYLQPVILILLMAVVLHAKLSPIKLAGVGMALIGMALVNGVSVGGSNPLLGILLGLGAAVLYAMIIFMNMVNPIVGKVDSLSKTTVQMLGAAVVMLFYVIPTYNGEFRELDLKSIVLLLILGLVHTGLAYYLYFSSIRELEGQSLALFGYIDPLSALIFAALFLNERMGPLQMLGAAFILGGAIIAELAESKKPQAKKK